MPESVSRNAGDLGSAQERTFDATSFQQTFGQASSTKTPDFHSTAGGGASVTPRLNTPGALNPQGGEPFRQDTSANLQGGQRLYMQQVDPRTEGQDQSGITYVRVAGNADPDGDGKNELLYNATATNTGVIGGGVAYTSDDKSTSVAALASYNSNPNVANATTIGGNAYYVPPGSPVGGYGSVQTNRLDAGAGAQTTEIGLYVPTGGGGRTDNLQPRGVIAGYRSTNSVNAVGVEGNKGEAFVRANAAVVNIGSTPVTLDGETAVNVDTGDQRYTISATAKTGPNSSVRVEGTYTNSMTGPDSGAAAVLYNQSF